MDTESTSQADTNRQSIFENGHASDLSFDETSSTKRQSMIYRNSWARLDNVNALANIANNVDLNKSTTNLEENGNKENEIVTVLNNVGGSVGSHPSSQRTSLILNGDMGPGNGGVLPTVQESKLEQGTENNHHTLQNSTDFEQNQQNNDNNAIDNRPTTVAERVCNITKGMTNAGLTNAGLTNGGLSNGGLSNGGFTTNEEQQQHHISTNNGMPYSGIPPTVDYDNMPLLPGEELPLLPPPPPPLGEWVFFAAVVHG